MYHVTGEASKAQIFPYAP